MTEIQVDAFVNQLSPDLDPKVRAGVMKIANYLKDPVIGTHVEKLLAHAVTAGSWDAFLASLESPRTAGGPGSGHHGHAGREGKIGGSAPGGDHSADQAKFVALKKQWATVNHELLIHIGNPGSPEAQAKINELRGIVKEMYTLQADPGGEAGIGLPGGDRDLVIVGAGPGGLTAAVMGGTDGLDTLFIDANTTAGGQAKFSSRIENFPGFPAGRDGSTLTDRMVQQAERVGAEGKLGTRVTGLSYDPVTRLKTVTLSDGTSVTARTVILAGGVEIKTLTFPGSDSRSIVYQNSDTLTKKGTGKDVVVVGGSNGAAQAALGAARTATSVTVLSRSPITKGMSDYQVNALRNNKKIRVIEGDEVASVSVDSKGLATGLVTKKGQQIPTGAVGMFIGGGPNIKWLPESIKRKKGLIDVDDHLETTMPGVFAVGDTRYGSIGRIGTAVGDGQMAERNALRWIHGITD